MARPDEGGVMPDPKFDDFVGACLPALSRYAYVLTGNVHAGEDLVQDTLVKLAGAWGRVRREGNPLGYARAVMFRTFVSRWRVLRRQPRFEPYSEGAAEQDQFAAVDTRDALRRAVASLPRLQRAVLVLGYLDDLPDEEIARLLERRPATIRSLRHRALSALRSRVESETTGLQDFPEVNHAAV
jgi:RNA polymerase sigma-70 factor (sigma-E family)